jgi:hypothetical protein
MNRIRICFVFLLALLGATASSSALAWHHGGVRFGVVVGAPFYPWWYYPPYYPPAVVTVPVSPPTYIEQGTSAQQSSGYWYYCKDSKTYYPYVKECPGGWQQVTPQPTPSQ